MSYQPYDYAGTVAATSQTQAGNASHDRSLYMEELERQRRILKRQKQKQKSGGWKRALGQAGAGAVSGAIAGLASGNPMGVLAGAGAGALGGGLTSAIGEWTDSDQIRGMAPQMGVAAGGAMGGYMSKNSTIGASGQADQNVASRQDSAMNAYGDGAMWDYLEQMRGTY